MPAQQTNYLPTWTTERVEILKKGLETGLSCREIAAQIGVSRNAVIGKISRLKLARDRTDLARAAKKEPTDGRRPRAAIKLRQIIVRAPSSEPDRAGLAERPAFGRRKRVSPARPGRLDYCPHRRTIVAHGGFCLVFAFPV